MRAAESELRSKRASSSGLSPFSLLPSPFSLDSFSYVAVTVVVIPPRAEKSPTTVIRRGAQTRDQVVEDLVGDRLVEDAAVAEVEHVVLQRLQLDAALVGDVG